MSTSSVQSGMRAADPLAGFFTYEPPSGVGWTHPESILTQ